MRICIWRDIIPLECVSITCLTQSSSIKDLIFVTMFEPVFKKSIASAYMFFIHFAFFSLRALFSWCDWWIKSELKLHKVPHRLLLKVPVKLLLTNPCSSGFIRKCQIFIIRLVFVFKTKPVSSDKYSVKMHLKRISWSGIIHLSQMHENARLEQRLKDVNKY